MHHAHTNHITKGETHVPVVVNARPGIENEGGEGELENARVPRRIRLRTQRPSVLVVPGHQRVHQS